MAKGIPIDLGAGVTVIPLRVIFTIKSNA